MKPDISEFSYGYAVTEALAERWRPHLTAAPAFPSLVHEGGAGGGYDVRLEPYGIPLFLQFKLSDYMVRGSVREVRMGILTVPFYRMHLRPLRQSRQHDLLLDLETTGNVVRYVAPIFHTSRELNAAYLSGQILQQSIFLRPSLIGPLPDGNNHHVAFNNRRLGYLLSEPRGFDEPLDDETFGREILEAVDELGAIALTDNALRRLSSVMIEILQRHLGGIEPGYDELVFPPLAPDEDPLRQIGYLSRTFFDSECVIVWRTAAQEER